MFLLVLGTCHITANKSLAVEESKGTGDTNVSIQENATQSADELYENAIASMDKKDYQSAIVYLTNYIDMKPKKYEGYKLRGDCFYALRQYILAQQDYQKSIDIKTADDRFITGTKVLGAMVLGADKEDQLQNPELGNLYARLMYSQKALNNSAYEGALAKAYEYNSHIYLPKPKKEEIALINCPQKYGKMLNPEGVDKYIYGAIEDIEKGDFNEAIYKTEYVTTNYPKFYLGYYLTGVALVGIDKENDAISTFETALKYNPYDFESMASLGQIYYTRSEKTFDFEETKKSNEYFNQALKYNPNCYLYYFYIGLNDLQLGNFSDAIEKFNKAIKINSNDYNSMYYRMIALYIKGDYKSVVDDSTKMLYRHVSNFNSVLYLRALAYNKLGNTNLALADIEKIQNGVDDIYNPDLNIVSEKEKTLESYIYYLKAQIMNELGFGAKADMDKALKNPIIAKLSSVDKSLNSFEDALSSSSISPEDYNKYNKFYSSELPKLLESNLEVSLTDIDNQYDYIRTAFDDLGITFEYKNPNYKLATIDNYVEKRYSSPGKNSDTNETVSIEGQKLLKQSTDQMDTLVNGTQSSIAQMLATNSLGMVTTPPTQVEDYEYSPVATIAHDDVEEQTVSEVKETQKNTDSNISNEVQAVKDEDVNGLKLRTNKEESEVSQDTDDSEKENTPELVENSVQSSDIDKAEPTTDVVKPDEKVEDKDLNTETKPEQNEDIAGSNLKSDSEIGDDNSVDEENKIRETHAQINPEDLEGQDESSLSVENEEEDNASDKTSNVESEEQTVQDNSEPVVIPETEDNVSRDKKIPVPVVVVPDLENKNQGSTQNVKQFVQKIPEDVESENSDASKAIENNSSDNVDLNLRSEVSENDLVADNSEQKTEIVEENSKSSRKVKEKKVKKDKIAKKSKNVLESKSENAEALVNDNEVNSVNTDSDANGFLFFKKRKTNENINVKENSKVVENIDTAQVANDLSNNDTEDNSQSLISSFVKSTFGDGDAESEDVKTSDLQLQNLEEPASVDENQTKEEQKVKKQKTSDKALNESQNAEKKKFSLKSFFAKFKKSSKKEDLPKDEVKVNTEEKILEDKVPEEKSFLPLKEIKSVDDNFDEPYSEEETKEIEALQKQDENIQQTENLQEKDVNTSENNTKVKKSKKKQKAEQEEALQESSSSSTEQRTSKKSDKKAKKEKRNNEEINNEEQIPTIDKNRDPLDDLQPLESEDDSKAEQTSDSKKDKKLRNKSENKDSATQTTEEKKKVHVPNAKDKYEVIIRDDKKKTIIKQMGK